MQTWKVIVSYTIYDNGTTTSASIAIKRKAKDAGTAIAIVCNLLTSLSNVDFDVSGTSVPYLTILSATVA